jgi:hypothetical protein
MEMVIALIMYLNNDMVEHTYKESLSKSVRFECKKVNAITEIYMGQKKIVKIMQ